MEKKTTQKNTTKDTEKVSARKTLQGVVVSDKMKDTCVVLIERYVKHPKYQKFINYRKRYKVHDVGNTKKIGETVTIVSCRPISRHKSFRIAA